MSNSVHNSLIEVFGDKIVLLQREADAVSRGGIFIPEDARRPMLEGIVIGVGDGRLTDSGLRIPNDVEIGDHIVYAKYGGAEVKRTGPDGISRTFIVISNSDILCRIPQDSEEDTDEEENPEDSDKAICAGGPFENIISFPPEKKAVKEYDL